MGVGRPSNRVLLSYQSPRRMRGCHVHHCTIVIVERSLMGATLRMGATYRIVEFMAFLKVPDSRCHKGKGARWDE